MKLTDEQKSVIKNLLKFDKQYQSLGGYAGTGKSVCVSALSYLLPNFAIGAYTGKAAHVLRKKGIEKASTIHGLIYKPIIDEFGNFLQPPKFKINYEANYEGFIIDEASMVSKEIHKDLCSFNVPIIYVGDHGQLEPIGQEINLMKNPDYKLETVHRNAGEIAYFAEWLREGRSSRSFLTGSKVKISSSSKGNFVDCDQVICAFNKTRIKINNIVREALGFKNKLNINEKIIFLRNNKQSGIFNGMQAIVTGIKKNKISFKVDDLNFSNVVCDFSQLNKEKYDFTFELDSPHPFDYANCGTAHKMQGSEFDYVTVIEQECNRWDHRRWAYTAASRAKVRLDWLI